jgi:hypothetical protein
METSSANKKLGVRAPMKTQDREIKQQPYSTLLRLPWELRDKIYCHAFLSTQITCGERPTGLHERHETMTIKPAPHSLALLRVCRQIHEETKSLWLGVILFNFEGVEGLLDKLWPLLSSSLSQIRRICTRSHDLPIHMPVGNHLSFPLAEVLRLLPSLRLDTLTVLGSKSKSEYGDLGGIA